MKYIGNNTLILNQVMMYDILADAINASTLPSVGAIKVVNFRTKLVNNCPQYEVEFEPVDQK